MASFSKSLKGILSKFRIRVTNFVCLPKLGTISSLRSSHLLFDVFIKFVFLSLLGLMDNATRREHLEKVRGMRKMRMQMDDEMARNRMENVRGHTIV